MNAQGLGGARPVATETAALLEMIAGDWVHDADREVIVAAIVAEAFEADGIVDPNKVRQRLRDPHSGELTVYARVVGPTYYALAKAGMLAPHGWTISDDLTGGNSGKNARLWRLTPTGSAPAASVPTPEEPTRVHPEGCVDGWLGDDPDAPRPCPVCRPWRVSGSAGSP